MATLSQNQATKSNPTMPLFGNVEDKIKYYQKVYQLEPRNSSKVTAKALGVDDTTLRKSRASGYLLGVDAPKHHKIGFTIQYRIEDIIDWIEAVECNEMEGL